MMVKVCAMGDFFHRCIAPAMYYVRVFWGKLARAIVVL
jgi:hypothetical protein